MKGGPQLLEATKAERKELQEQARPRAMTEELHWSPGRQQLCQKSTPRSVVLTKSQHNRDESKEGRKRSTNVGLESSVLEIREGSCH